MKTKKYITQLLFIGLLAAMIFPISSHAAQENSLISTEITYFDDGTYLETTIYENNSTTLRATNTKTATKTTRYKSNDETLWYVSVTGTFTYTGTTSKCTSSFVDANSYDAYWKISNTSSSYSGNSATAKATAKLYYGIVVIKTLNESVTLTCSSNGNLS